MTDGTRPIFEALDAAVLDAVAGGSGTSIDPSG
jgi:hypothetical protein